MSLPIGPAAGLPGLTLGFPSLAPATFDFTRVSENLPQWALF